MTDSAILESVEAWLKEFSVLLGAPKAPQLALSRFPVRANDDPQMVWWRCSVGQPPVFVWIGAAASDVAVVCPSQTGGSSQDFRDLLDRASGMSGEITEENPLGASYETWTISISSAGEKEEMEIFSVLSQPQPVTGADPAIGALPGYGAGALMDVELPLTLRFGSTRMPLQELAGLAVGSVIEFDGSLGDPVELMVNGRVIARGQAVVLQGCYALRISEIASPRERLFSAEQKAVGSPTAQIH